MLRRIQARTSVNLRRWAMACLAVVTCMTAITAIAALLDQRLLRADHFSGYMLLAVTASMMLLSVRKKLLVIPIGRVVYWQRAHQYLGLLCIGLFIFHAGLSIRGWFEGILAMMFWFISLSGIVGWWINYSTPKRMLAAGPAVLRDDIVHRRRSITDRAYAIALAAAGKLESATLAEYYTNRLASFFQKRRSLAYAVIPNGRTRRLLIQDLEQLNRFLGPDGRKMQTALGQLVQEKDDLDFQWAMQTRLRVWVISHVALVWSFYALVAIHIYWVYHFYGS